MSEGKILFENVVKEHTYHRITEDDIQYLLSNSKYFTEPTIKLDRFDEGDEETLKEIEGELVNRFGEGYTLGHLMFCNGDEEWFKLNIEDGTVFFPDPQNSDDWINVTSAPDPAILIFNNFDKYLVPNFENYILKSANCFIGDDR